MVDKSQETTHFGFQTVAKEQKADMVAHVFHSVASKYDVMNDLMSFGIHRLWKRFTIDCSGVRRGQTVLDLAGGTGDLTAKFSRLVGETGKVVLADINESMLKMGREKLRNIGVIGNVEYVQANAEALPFPDNTFDCITISFGLRNVTDKDKALRSMYRVLKPGGSAFFAFINNDMVFITEAMVYNPDFLDNGRYDCSTFKVADLPFVFLTLDQVRRWLATLGWKPAQVFAADGMAELLADKVNAPSAEQFHPYTVLPFWVWQRGHFQM